jgi:diguanylate cyclase (GGDEF)-like protein/PAS domain S-box-containing protein
MCCIIHILVVKVFSIKVVNKKRRVGYESACDRINHSSLPKAGSMIRVGDVEAKVGGALHEPLDGAVLRQTGLLVFLLSALFLALWLAPHSHAFEGIARFLPLHSFMEIFAVVVAAMVFGVGWNAYSAERPANIVLLSCAFLAVGLLDFAHMLSYQGMPDFVTPSGAQKAIDFWLTARLIAALALLSVAFLPWKPFSAAWMRYALLAGSLGITLLVYWVVLYHEAALPATFVPGKGLTPFKIGSEYAIVLIHLLTAGIILARSRRSLSYQSAHLLTAVAIMALGELAFTLYSNVTDVFNLLGHVYKVLAYIFIYRAVFVSSVQEPYLRLRQSEREVLQEKERAQVTLTSIGDGVITTDKDGLIEYLNPVAEKLSGWGNAEVQGKPVKQVFNVINEHTRIAVENPVEECLHKLSVVALTNHTILIRRDGTQISIEDTAAPILDRDGGGIGAVLVFHDVTEKAKIRNERKRLSSILEATPDLVSISTVDGKRVYLNQAGRRMLGLSDEEDVAGLPVLDAYPEWIRGFMENEAMPLVAESGVWRGEAALLSRDGVEIPVSQVTIAHKNADGNVEFVSTIARDISERKRFEEQLVHQATHDALSGLPNRLLFYDRLGQALAQAGRAEGVIAVMLLDLNRFKTINDTLGHDTGDLLLKEVAHRLAGCLREKDSIARWGGDEFTFLLPDLVHPEEAAEVATKILVALSHPFKLADEDMYINASIGITLYPTDGRTREGLVQNAEVAMYRAKEQGESAYQFFTGDMNARAFERLTLENSLRKALERGELMLYYQPQVDLKTGKISGMEALLRWRHPDFGMVSPSRFIPLAEETGLIVPIGEWVLREACRQNKAWQDAGMDRMRVSVNLSARQFRQQDIVEMTAAVLKETGLAPDCLELELTESYIMQNPEAAILTLEKLKKMEVHLSVDDFGTGYSSLSYLRRFPIDCLKIDRSFVQDIPGSADATAIVSAIVAMARSLMLEVVAEGVETGDQLAHLKQLRCNRMQGFLFSRAVAADEFEKLVKNQQEILGFL